MSSSNVNHLSHPCIYERKSWFMKWLSKFFKSGASSREVSTGGQQPQFIGDENMAWRAPYRSVDDRSRANKEKEELDRAIALSLAEDLNRPNGYRWQTGIDEDLARPRQRWQTDIDEDLARPRQRWQTNIHEDLARPRQRWQTDIDEDLARPRQRWQTDIDEDLARSRQRWRTDIDEDLARSHHGSLNSAPFPSYAPREYHPRGHRTCAGCQREIGYGNYLGCMGLFYHPKCFCCHACGNPITEHEFSLSGRETYHKSCFKELTHPKCEVCHQFIPTNEAGLIEYRCHPFWLQKYCPSHEHDNTDRCCSCERLESRNTKYISLGDGRSLCLECMESAIMDTGDCQPLYHSIRDYYEGMNMRIDQQIPMLLVERQALNEAIEGEKHGYHHMPETRGLCLSEEQTVTSILRRPRMERRGLVGIRTQPQKLTRKCEVTAILVLYGLPRLLTGAILAHELMHGWLRLNSFRNLRPEVEEGICQVLSHMWLESEVLPTSRNTTSTSSSSSTWSYGSTSSSSWPSSKKGGKSSVENKLGKFFLHQIVNDASPAYGGGYRAAAAAVDKYGLRPTLDHIRYTGTFPE